MLLLKIHLILRIQLYLQINSFRKMQNSMKKIIIILLVSVSSLTVIGQDTSSIKPSSIAFKIGLFNFKNTPSTENASQTVIQGGLQYFKGITEHLDLMLNLDFTKLKYPFYTSSKLDIAKKNEMYTAFDASLNYKLLTDENKLVPYVSAGLGAASSFIPSLSASGIGHPLYFIAPSAVGHLSFSSFIPSLSVSGTGHP